ncbi:MAG TPA: OmpH family outer membrane protein [bacterium]|nr:OmpH family outer membrane protein [bacterium]
MKTKLTLALAAALSLGSVQAFAMRIAIVDVKYVFDHYNGTQSAKDKLKAQVDEEKGKLEKDQDVLKKKMDDLQAKKSVLSEDKFKEQQDAVMGEVHDLQTRIQATTDDLQKREADMTAAIVGVIKDSVKKVAQDNKYDFVFDKSDIVYGDADDITNKVTLDLNNK